MFEFKSFGPSDLPPYRKPLLVKLKADKCLKFKTDKSSHDTKQHFGGDTFYGYAVVILSFDLDGFGRPFPKEFQRLSVGTNGFANTTGGVPLDSVAGWMELPS